MTEAGLSRTYQFRIDPSSEQLDAIEHHHARFNAGARVFADWLLCMRGGLDASHGSDVEARVMLTHSWLSVESKDDAPADGIVPSTVGANATVWHTVRALEQILEQDGLHPAARAQWIEDVRSGLEGAIREGSVWVNRRARFNALRERVVGWGDPDTVQTDIRDMLFDSGLFSQSAYFSLTTDDGAKKPPSANTAVGNWVSRRLGTGEGTDFGAKMRVYAVLRDMVGTPFVSADEFTTAVNGTLGIELHSSTAQWIAEVRRAATVTGRSDAVAHALAKYFANGGSEDAREALARTLTTSLAEVESFPKARRQYADRILAEIESAVGLQHTGSGGALTHYRLTPMCASAARRVTGLHSFVRNAEGIRAKAEVDAKKTLAPRVRELLDDYSDARTIRKRALGGWPEVLKAWKTCTSEQERIDAIASVQRELRGKFGDATLFRALAHEDFAACWKAGALQAYVTVCDAERKIRRYKTPSFRHIHPWNSPVWPSYGNSNWAADVRPNDTGLTATIDLIGADGAIRTELVAAKGSRFAEEIGRHCKAPETQNQADEPILVSRADRLGLMAAGAVVGQPGISVQPIGKDWPLVLRFDRRDDGTRRWLLTSSPKLRAQPQDAAFLEHLKKVRSVNADRARQAWLIFARAPGVRVLSVDLGVRSAAACSVVCSVSRDFVDALCREHGVPAPTESDRSLSLPVATENGRTSLRRFRRVAADRLAGGEQHPAPWAEIEDAFLIRLPGEERTRKPSPAEYARASEILGLIGADPATAGTILDLQVYVTRCVRRAVAQHGQRGAALYGVHTLLAGADVVEARVLKRFEKSYPPALDEPSLLAGDRRQVFDRLKTEWEARDPVMQAALGKLSRWIVRGDELHEDLGGVSQAHIACIIECRKAQMSFAMRFHPTRPREEQLARGKFAIKALDAANALKEERMRVTANRLVEAALGGRRRETDPLGVQAFPRCQAIVIEDLDEFRTHETRTRFENRTLMKWGAHRLRTLLEQSAGINGLHVEQVRAAYSSQIDGYSGEPGLCVSHVAVTDFINRPRWLERRLESARVAIEPTAEDRLLRAICSRWNADAQTWTDQRGRIWKRGVDRWIRPAMVSSSQHTPDPVLIPDQAGELFVSLGHVVPTHRDINAAVEIGIRAFLDSDWFGAWAYIPTEGGVPTKSVRDIVGAAALELEDVPPGKKKGARDKQVVNAWADRSTRKWVSYAGRIRLTRDRICEMLMFAFRESSQDQSLLPRAEVVESLETRQLQLL